MTPQEHIEVAKKIAEEITNQGLSFGLSECIVDDWGRYSNFSLIVYLDLRKFGGTGNYYPMNKQTFNLKKIVGVIKRVIKSYGKNGARFLSHESPRGVYYTSYGVSSFDGYERSYITIDLNF
jgi:hypothetical protein